MKKWLLTLLYIVPLGVQAQRVQFVVSGTPVTIQPVQTQTEVRAGWRIVDIQLKNRVTRYLFGRHSSQLTDDGQPRFLIQPSDGETLVDYALIRLREKRDCRRLPAALLMANPYTRVEPSDFEIAPAQDDAFECRPRQPLPRGEYVLVSLIQRPIDPLGDYLVYPFQVP